MLTEKLVIHPKTNFNEMLDPTIDGSLIIDKMRIYEELRNHFIEEAILINDVIDSNSNETFYPYFGGYWKALERFKKYRTELRKEHLRDYIENKIESMYVEHINEMV
ncbi:hypothetical protein [Paenibacillus sp. FSL H7-0331]|uniref:hypothetical protein n=1 Tax=Paenibacillus sp. FSL H7-0331 TaxID=1920421 RepID=UPI00096F25F0|nr:hypothetical protein [Paenibacillus sp. FSL H7-0331]OMF04883.1 hypothetical protein BK127_33005 [Paenibacillus sp. FSL H7-0331]